MSVSVGNCGPTLLLGPRLSITLPSDRTNTKPPSLPNLPSRPVSPATSVPLFPLGSRLHPMPQRSTSTHDPLYTRKTRRLDASGFSHFPVMGLRSEQDDPLRLPGRSGRLDRDPDNVLSGVNGFDDHDAAPSPCRYGSPAAGGMAMRLKRDYLASAVNGCCGECS
jgi:hypothetical protein